MADKKNYDTLGLLDSLVNLGLNEPEQYGALNEPIKQYQASIANLEQSRANTQAGFEDSVNKLQGNTDLQQQKAANQVLATGGASPFSLQQAQKNTALAQGNTLGDIRGKFYKDRDIFNLQKKQVDKAFASSLSPNLLTKSFDRLKQTTGNSVPYNWVENMFKPKMNEDIFNNFIKKVFK